MSRLHKMAPGFQRGKQSSSSELRKKRDPNSNQWYFHSNKLGRLLLVESDVLFFCVVLLEFRPDVIAYDSLPEDSPESVRAKGADLVVQFANGKTEYWWCQRDPEKGRKRKSDPDFRFVHGGDVEIGRVRFDNSLLLAGAITAACDYDCNPTRQAILQTFGNNSSVSMGDILAIPNLDAGLAHAVVAQLLSDGTWTTDLDKGLLCHQSVLFNTSHATISPSEQLPGSLGKCSGTNFPGGPGSDEAPNEHSATHWGQRPLRMIPPEYHWAAWPCPSESEIPDGDRALYAKRKEIVDAYRRGFKYSSIRMQFKVSDGEVRRLVKRCVTPRPGGGIYGYYALLPGTQLERRKECVVERPSKPGRDAWSDLLESVEGLADSIKSWVLEGDLEREASPLDITDLHAKLVQELHKAEVGDSDYPLSNVDRGQDALYRYVRVIEKAHLLRFTRIHRGEEAEQRALYLGCGHRRIMRPLRPGSFVQLDYWRTDKLSKILVNNGYGDTFEAVLPKFYFAVLVDELYSFVLSGYPTLEKTPSTESAIETVDRFVHHNRYRQSDFVRNASIDNLGPCFSPELVERTSGSRFNVLRVDNAWANLSDAFIRAVVYAFGAAVNFGPTYTWVTRAVVERVIGNIARLVRKSLENEPVPSLEHLRHAMDEACALHNTSKTRRLNYSAPVTALRTAIARENSGLVVMPLPTHTINHSTILDHYFLAPLKRNDKADVRPTFEKFGHRYENKVLGAHIDLLRRRGAAAFVAGTVKRYDVRDVTAGVVDGAFVGQMAAVTKPDELMSLSDAVLLNRTGKQSRVLEKQAQVAAASTRKSKPNTAALEQARRDQREALHGKPVDDVTSGEVANAPQQTTSNVEPVQEPVESCPPCANVVITLDQESVLQSWGKSGTATPALSGRVPRHGQEMVLTPWSSRPVDDRSIASRKNGRGS